MLWFYARINLLLPGLFWIHVTCTDLHAKTKALFGWLVAEADLL
jgi:hypothetical protein